MFFNGLLHKRWIGKFIQSLIGRISMTNNISITAILTIFGWWYTYPSEKYDFVSWDDDIPNWMESRKMFQTTKQIYIYIM